MKKIVYLFLIFCFPFAISSCAKQEDPKVEGDNATSSSSDATSTSTGSGTIKGTVKYDNNTSADNVNVSFTLNGSIVGSTTTDTSGDFNKDNLSLGTHTLSYTKSNFKDVTQSAELVTDNQTLVVSTLTLLSNSCSAGNISGTITDAVSGNAVADVSISIRSGINYKSGSTVSGKTDTTDSSGDYSLNSVDAGAYTVEASKSGYISAYFNVNVCNNLSDQDAAISTSLSSETMRIVLTWPSGSTATDLDSHLTIPDNSSGDYHIYFSKKKFFYVTNSSSCSGCDNSDNVTLDRDTTSAPGTETITISKVRNGEYYYRVHNWTNRTASSNTNLATSGASVKVYYNDTVTTYNVPNIAGTLWGVFTFNNSSGGFTAIDNMTEITFSNAANL